MEEAKLLKASKVSVKMCYNLRIKKENGKLGNSTLVSYYKKLLKANKVRVKKCRIPCNEKANKQWCRFK